MALSPTEESLVRQLIAQNPALLNLASSESTIISKLGATKVSLSDLSAATSLSDADLALVRQGLNDKSFAMSVLLDYVSANLPTASTTTKGIVELATNTETQTGTDAVRAVTPAGLASLKTSSPTDTTAGRLLKVGDFGIGEVNSAPLAVDLNSLPAAGSYQITNITLNRPFDYGTVFEQRYSAAEKTQIATPVTSEQMFFRKFQSGLEAWSAWREMYHTGNLGVATETRAGLIEIATTAEAQALSNDTHALTPAKLAAALDVTALGRNQAWQDVTGSRAPNTNYTNTTGRAIAIAISTIGGGASPPLTIAVGGVAMWNSTSYNDRGQAGFAIVPAWHTYSASWGGSLRYWMELQ